MVVQHNLTAMNSNRMLGITQGSQAKSTEKLSSGYKINRAADDAAGLSISEKMRKQIRGLTQASLNAEDGISAVQTAEGALNEVQDMLQRMNELAVKAANGTMSENDRNYIQDEIAQLETEIDRVAETTKFNETYLLKGDKTAEKEFTFSYVTTTPYTFEVKDTTTTTTAATAAAPKNNKEFYVANSTTKVSNDDLLTYIESDGSALKAAAPEMYVATGTSTVTTDNNAGTLDDVNGLILRKKADGSIIALANDADISTYLNGGLGTGTTGTIKTEYEIVKKVVISDIDVTTGSTTSTAPYALVDKTTNQAVTDLSAYVEWDADNNAMKYKDGMQLKVSGGVDIEANALATYITAEAGEPEAASFYDADGNKIAANALDNYITATEDEATGDITYALADGAELYKEDGTAYTVAELDTSDEIAALVTGAKDLVGALTLKLHVGADATENNQISIDIDTMSAKGLGVKGILVSGKDDTNARAAIDTIKEAIQKVSTQRSALGAVQNRLEHTINNLDNVVENTTAAESQIRDTDMATEMVKYSNNNILAQAGQSMLAQANQANQGVLSLLG